MQQYVELTYLLLGSTRSFVETWPRGLSSSVTHCRQDACKHQLWPKWSNYIPGTTGTPRNFVPDTTGKATVPQQLFPAPWNL